MKRFLSMLLVVVLTATLAVSGTLAYLQDEDSDVNVMTLGNVYIEQHEYEREVDANGNYVTDATYGYKLKDFTQGKPLLPIVGDPNEPGNSPAYAGYDDTIVRMTQVDSYGSMDVFEGKNAQDKFVTVENTGKTDAYVRTLVALELGDIAYADFAKIIMTSTRSTTDNTNLKQPWYKNEIGVVEIDGNNYVLVEFIYHGAELNSGSIRHEKGILPAGDTTYPSLCQVYLKHNATNEDMVAIDGNKNGTYDILVVSQAVQAAGFADAETALNAGFGEITKDNHPWVDGVKLPVVVTNDAELKAAIDEGAEEIILESGNYGVIDVTVNRALTLSAAANAEVKIAGIDGQSNNNSTNVTIKGVTIDNSLQTEGWYTGTAQNIKPCVGVWGGNYTFENCTFYVTGESGAETGVMSWWTTNKGVMNFTNCTFNGGNGSARGMQIYGNYDLNVTHCTFNTKKDYSIKYVGAEGCIATFKNNNVTETTNFVQTGSAPYAGNNYSLVFEDNTLASGINHVYVDNAEGQTITIDGEVKAADTGKIY